MNRETQPSESIFRRFFRGIAKIGIGVGALAIAGRVVGELFHIDRLTQLDAGRFLVAMSAGAAALLLLRRQDRQPQQAQSQEQDRALQWAHQLKNFFDQDPRSSILRNVSLDALHAYSGVLAGAKANQQRLDDSLQALRMLGISPNLHAVDPNDPQVEAKELKIAEDPVLYTEWFSGQLLSHFDQLGHTGQISGIAHIQDIGNPVLRDGYDHLGALAGWTPNLQPN